MADGLGTSLGLVSLRLQEEKRKSILSCDVAGGLVIFIGDWLYNQRKWLWLQISYGLSISLRLQHPQITRPGINVTCGHKEVKMAFWQFSKVASSFTSSSFAPLSRNALLKPELPFAT